ncbi:unnamed protein product [Gordionus sp. m RMFG-2023]|uniref:REST corepressor 2-like n=1 Tax=Gordionus sp. m RMFG-2023 TaxID=3053472 RepID=UPI0030DE040C
MSNHFKRVRLQNDMNTERLKSDDEDLSDEYSKLIGRDYQAIITDYDPDEALIAKDKDICLWSPKNIKNFEPIYKFIELARFDHGYSFDQALAVINWHDFDIDLTLKEIKNWRPQINDWSMADKYLFEQAFRYCGKNFRMIQQLVPHKSHGELVTYYYNRKKLKHCKSFIDIQLKSLQTQKRLKLDAIYNANNNQNNTKTNESLALSSNPLNNIFDDKCIFEKPEIWKLNDKDKINWDFEAQIHKQDFDLFLKHHKPSQKINLMNIESNENKIDDISIHSNDSPSFKESLFANLNTQIYKLKCIVRRNHQIIAQKNETHI